MAVATAGLRAKGDGVTAAAWHSRREVASEGVGRCVTRFTEWPATASASASASATVIATIIAAIAGIAARVLFKQCLKPQDGMVSCTANRNYLSKNKNSDTRARAK